MKIRGATKKDLRQCEKILKINEFRFSDRSYPNSEFLINYLNKNYFLIIEENNEIKGCLIAEPLKAYNVIIWFIAIKAEYKGKGLGKKLLSEFEKRCKNKGIKYIILYCPTSSKSSNIFYKKKKYIKNKSFFEFNKEL